LFLLAVGPALPGLALARPDNPSRVIGSKHDLSVSSPGPVTSTVRDACIFCHGSHLPGIKKKDLGPLWNRDLPVLDYKTYASSTMDALPGSLAEGSSKLCLSCHDGTIGPGQTRSRGLIRTQGALGRRAVRGENLSADHPVGFEPIDDGQLFAGLFESPPHTADDSVGLFGKRLECLSCHTAHEPARDEIVQKFLVRDNSGGSLCLACHDPSRPFPNRVRGWPLSAHAKSSNTVPGGDSSFGVYGTVESNACLNCHQQHGTTDAGGSWLLREREEAACFSCHSGEHLTPTIANVMDDFAKTYAHPATTLMGLHDPTENAFPLNENRHAECVDCHQPHSAQVDEGNSIPPAVAPALVGVSGFDGVDPLRPATREYEVCFKCHAHSAGKPQDTLGYNAFGYTPRRQADRGLPDPHNLREKLSSGSARHNVMQSRRLSDAEVPSLRPYIQRLDGSQGRSLALGTYIYCTDCHANDSAARAGGGGANGPHGSIYAHILVARYEQEAPPAVVGQGFGQGVSYVPGPGGSYALCNLCHDVEESVVQDYSFTKHRQHVVEEQASCSTCHEPHGIQDAGGNTVNNHRLVSFDLTIVGPDRMGRLYFDSGARECYLSCHGVEHSPARY
jgi:predicted CXXCH cytochrome family protein